MARRSRTGRCFRQLRYLDEYLTLRLQLTPNFPRRPKISPKLLKERSLSMNLAQIEKVAKALGDATRLKIYEHIASRGQVTCRALEFARHYPRHGFPSFEDSFRGWIDQLPPRGPICEKSGESRRFGRIYRFPEETSGQRQEMKRRSFYSGSFFASSR